VIKTNSKENVLVIPKSAILKNDGKTFVQVLKGKSFEEREIEIGLQGSGDMVEVVSGLAEGERLVIK
jgi:multidrug efflux pump subunit AcrA (membrane-fusion protein)